MKTILSFLGDGEGNMSSMRLALLYIVFSIMTAWWMISIRSNTMIPIDWSQLAALIAAFTAKTVQSRAENTLPHGEGMEGAANAVNTQSKAVGQTSISRPEPVIGLTGSPTTDGTNFPTQH